MDRLLTDRSLFDCYKAWMCLPTNWICVLNNESMTYKTKLLISQRQCFIQDIWLLLDIWLHKTLFILDFWFKVDFRLIQDLLFMTLLYMTWFTWLWRYYFGLHDICILDIDLPDIGLHNNFVQKHNLLFGY